MASPLPDPPPDATQPDATQPDATQPDATQADAIQPEATQPDAAQADAGAPVATTPSRSDDPLLLWPGDLEWRSVSPKLTTVRRVGLLMPAVSIIATVVLTALFSSWVWLPWLIGIGGAAFLVWSWVLIGRAVRSWGYGERDDDLLVRHGVVVRRLSVVPYGRMQFVDVQAGPLERLLGLATVKLHTAAAASDATIPGLPAAEAARLRDSLAALGEARAAGL